MHSDRKENVHMSTDLQTFTVLDVPIARVTMDEAIAQVNEWAVEATTARLVTFTNVHMVVEARMRPRFGAMLRRTDLNLSDGMPIFVLGALQFGRQVSKVSGPEFMPRFCEQSVALGHRHYLYGGGEGVAEDTGKALQARYPGLQIAGHYSPPYGPMSESLTRHVIDEINASGADILWVCLGCPKQEQWMSDNKYMLKPKVVLAVGQAFDILSGRKKRAPSLVSSCGLEWLYRLVKEPRRLAKRYVFTNCIFLYLLLRRALKGQHKLRIRKYLAQVGKHKAVQS